MAKLIVKFSGEVIDHLDIKQGDMKVGRRPGSDILLDNLAVSGEHANIFTIGEDSFIQDLGSTNGTFVNNKKITKHHLRNGDTVTIGKHTLIYMTDQIAPQANKTPDFAKTVIINPGVAREPGAEAPPIVTPVPAATDKPSPLLPPIGGEIKGAIVILSGPNSGKRIELTKTITNLGKIGKRAGIITKGTDAFLLAPCEDGGEIPKLNGRPVEESQGVPLKNGDVIEVAGTRLQFLMK